VLELVAVVGCRILLQKVGVLFLEWKWPVLGLVAVVRCWILLQAVVAEGWLVEQMPAAVRQRELR
jgi:hypothetical protein